MKNKRITFYINPVFCFFVFLTSCTPVRNIVYFQNVHTDSISRDLVNKNLELKIRKNDQLSINIISPDPVSTPLFNLTQSNNSSGESGGSNAPTGGGGYLVDKDGNIVMYKLGVVHVEGLTRNELKNKLQNDLSPYLKDAVITIRFLNNHVTLLGEVVKPQVLAIPNEQLTLLEAIAQSGDLTFTGRRDNILIIRETDKGKQFERLNLTDKSIFSSPFYYLQPDDVVYVEPTKTKIKSTGPSQQIIGYVLSGLSIFITLLSLLIR